MHVLHLHARSQGLHEVPHDNIHSLISTTCFQVSKHYSHKQARGSSGLAHYLTPPFAEPSKLSPLLAFVLTTSLHLLIAYALSKLCEMVTGAMSTSGEANYTGPHSEEYILTRPGAKRQRLGDAQVDDNDADLFYAEPTYSWPSGARASTQRVPSFDLPKCNTLFEKIKPAPMELTDLTKFSVAKMYSLFYNLHAVPQQMLEELVKYSWILSASNFFLSRALHASFYRKNQLPQEVR
jgi:hypothetical protein